MNDLEQVKELATIAVDWLRRPGNQDRAETYAAVTSALAAVISAAANLRQAAALERIADKFDTGTVPGLLPTLPAADVDETLRIPCWQCNGWRKADMSSCPICNAPPAGIPF